MLETFNHNITRKITASLGTLFNEIQVERKDRSGTVQDTINVPLAYAARQAYIQRLRGDSSVDDEIDIKNKLPRISFMFTDMQYAPKRKKNTMNYTIYGNESGDVADKVREPVPYDLEYEVNVFSKNIEDGLMIVEQIVPYFTPSFNIPIRLHPKGETIDTPVILNGVSHEDNYDEGFSENRLLTWTLKFNVETYFFPPTNENQAIIKESIANIRDEDTDSILRTLTETP